LVEAGQLQLSLKNWEAAGFSRKYQQRMDALGRAALAEEFQSFERPLRDRITELESMKIFEHYEKPVEVVVKKGSPFNDKTEGKLHFFVPSAMTMGSLVPGTYLETIVEITDSDGYRQWFRLPKALEEHLSALSALPSDFEEEITDARWRLSLDREVEGRLADPSTLDLVTPHAGTRSLVGLKLNTKDAPPVLGVADSLLAGRKGLRQIGRPAKPMRPLETKEFPLPVYTDQMAVVWSGHRGTPISGRPTEATLVTDPARFLGQEFVDAHLGEANYLLFYVRDPEDGGTPYLDWTVVPEADALYPVYLDERVHVLRVKGPDGTFHPENPRGIAVIILQAYRPPEVGLATVKRGVSGDVYSPKGDELRRVTRLPDIDLGDLPTREEILEKYGRGGCHWGRVAE
jgi:hypothetical protein